MTIIPAPPNLWAVYDCTTSEDKHLPVVGFDTSVEAGLVAAVVCTTEGHLMLADAAECHIEPPGRGDYYLFDSVVHRPA